MSKFREVKSFVHGLTMAPPGSRSPEQPAPTPFEDGYYEALNDILQHFERIEGKE